MRIVSVSIARPVSACWDAFVDHTTLLRWVPGLRKAELVEFDIDGLPYEIRFLFAAGLEYSLRYTYDPQNRLVHWEPTDDAGRRLGVRGYASFRAVDGGVGPSIHGTELEYALEHEPDRKAAERALDDPQLLVEAFARFMHEA